jgi:hypothetical protein
MARWSLRAMVVLTAAGCAGLVATKVVGRRRALRRVRLVPDPPDGHLAEEWMAELATSEGMPEADGGGAG